MTDPAGRTPRPRQSGEAHRYVVIGAYVTDCLVSTGRIPAWGEEHEARSVRTSPGGKALNQAVALARRGAQVTAVGVVGGDGVGHDILAVLAAEGIDTSGIEVRAAASTAVCVCFVGDQGESAIVWHIDDDAALTPATVIAAAPQLRQADSVLITFEMPPDAIDEAIRAASDSGAMVFVQPAPPLADLPAAIALPWDLVDVVMCNEAEARVLIGDVNQALGAASLAGSLANELGVKTVAVTLGAEGCVTFADGVAARYPAQLVTAVDTTGAGDAFAAAFAASIVAGLSVPAAVQAAQEAATQAVLHHGGHEAASAEPSGQHQ